MELAPGATLSLDAREPFDFGQTLAFLRGFTPCAGDHGCRTGELLTGGYADEPPFVARVSADGSTLHVEVEWVDGAGNPDEVARWLDGFLSLSDDLTRLYAVGEDDPAFEPVLRELHGYHHVRFTTPFEAACWAALSQRTPMAVARSQKRRLVEAAGAILERDGVEVALFPTPRRVLDREEAVREALGNERKSKTLLSAAGAFTGGLDSLGDAELVARLGEVWGFGEWSAEFVTLRGFGRLTSMPRTEDRLRAAVGELYGLDGPATDGDLDRLSGPYAPDVGYWAHYVRVWADRRDRT